MCNLSPFLPNLLHSLFQSRFSIARLYSLIALVFRQKYPFFLFCLGLFFILFYFFYSFGFLQEESLYFISFFVMNIFSFLIVLSFCDMSDDEETMRYLLGNGIKRGDWIFLKWWIPSVFHLVFYFAIFVCFSMLLPLISIELFDLKFWWIAFFLFLEMQFFGIVLLFVSILIHSSFYSKFFAGFLYCFSYIGFFAKDYINESVGVFYYLIQLLYYTLPNFKILDVKTELVYSFPFSLEDALMRIGYCIFYSLFLWKMSLFLFSQKDI